MAIDAAQLRILFTSDGAERVQGDIQRVGQSVDGASSGFNRLRQSALGFGTALIAPMGLGLKAAVDLEQSIANVDAALGGVDPGILDQLAASFQEIGAASQYSATGVANIGEALIKAGFDADELLNGMTQSVVDLAQATGDGLEPAVAGVIQAMSTWKEGIVDADIAMTDAGRVADILTVAANESSAGLVDIQAGMRSLGPVAAQMGIGFDESAAAIALFTNNGLKGADAGVSLARGLQNLADPTSEAATMMADLGIAAFDAEGSFVGFPSLFRQLQTSMAGMSDQAQLTALSTIFGAEAMDVMGLAIMNGAEPLEALIALMGESGAAAEQSAIRMDTLGAQFDTLIEGATTFLSSLVQGLIPGLRWLVDTANLAVDALMRIPEPIKTIVGAVAGGLAAFAALTRAIQAFQAIDMLLGGGNAAAKSFGLPIGPIAAFTAAIGSAYLAYRTDFLGIRSIMDRVADTARYFGETWEAAFASFTDAGGRRLASALKATGVALRQVSGVMGPLREVTLDASQAFTGFARVVGAYDWFRNTQGLSRFESAMAAIHDTTNGVAAVFPGLYRVLGPVATAVDDLTYNFRQFRDAGVGPVESALMSLGVVFPQLEGAFRPLVIAFDQFRQGDYAGMFASIGESLQNIAVGIGSWVLDVGVPVVTGWIADAASDVWAAVSAAAGWAWDGFVQLGAWTLETAVPAVTGWIATAAISVWDALKSAAGWAWDGLTDIGAWTLDTATPAVTGWVADAAGDAWTAISTAAGWVWDKLVSLGAWTLETAAPTVAGWVANAAGNIWPYLQAAAGWVWSRLVDLGHWTLNTAAPTISGWLMSASGNIWPYLQAAAGFVWDRVEDLGHWTLNVAAPTVSGWLDDIGGWMQEQLEGIDLGSAIANAGGEVSSFATGILNWLTAQIESIDWNSVGQTIGEGIGNTLLGIGTFITGFFTENESEGGFGQALVDFLITSVEAAESLLTGIGEGIASSLWDGLETAFSGFSIDASFFSGLWEGILTSLEDVVQGAIDLLNKLIDSINMIPGVDIPKIPGIDQIGKDADSASAKVESLYSRLASLSTDSLAAGIFTPMHGADNAKYDEAFGMGSPYANPYNPTEGGVGIEYQPITVDVTADTSQAEQAIAGLGGLAGQVAATVAVNADTAGAAGEVAGFRAATLATPVMLMANADTSGAESDVSALGDTLSATPLTIPVKLSMAQDAGAALGGAASGVLAGLGLDTQTATITVTADTSAAMQAIDAVRGSMSGIDGLRSTVVLQGDNGAALAAIEDVRGSMSGIDGMTSTIFIDGDNSGALAAIGEIQAYNGAILATSYIDIVTRQIGESPVGRATGGTVREDLTLVGERGPELVSLPYGSYVHTASETRGMLASPSSGGGGPVTINNYITPGEGMDSEALAAEVTRRTVTAIRDEAIRYRTAYGGTF